MTGFGERIYRILSLTPLLLLAQVPVSGRIWTYGNLTAIVHPHWAYTIMPGFRYEFARNGDQGSESKGLYFYEFLSGPVYSVRIHNMTIKIPIWYYYMGFPVQATGEHYFSHNIEFLPVVSYRFKPVIITSRTIFHNTVYASVYSQDNFKNGYGLVLRQLLRLDIPVSKAITITVGEEPFFGIIEDSEAPSHPLGYWEAGFRMNRVYAGLVYRPIPRISISPQHVYESVYDSQGDLSSTNHYLFLTISYTLRTIK